MFWRKKRQTSELSELQECFICHTKYLNPKIDMPMLKFNWLDTNPAICEKCIFEKLTGIRLEWRKDCKFLDDNEIV